MVSLKQYDAYLECVFASPHLKVSTAGGRGGCSFVVKSVRSGPELNAVTVTVFHVEGGKVRTEKSQSKRSRVLGRLQQGTTKTRYALQGVQVPPDWLERWFEHSTLGTDWYDSVFDPQDEQVMQVIDAHGNDYDGLPVYFFQRQTRREFMLFKTMHQWTSCMYAALWVARCHYHRGCIASVFYPTQDQLDAVLQQ